MQAASNRETRFANYLASIAIFCSISAGATPIDITAHRGGDTNDLAESSPEAMRRAITQGANRLEFDVVRMADGTLVIHHNFELGKNEFSTSLEQLRTRDLRQLNHSDIEQLRYKIGGGKQKIFTLTEFLKAMETVITPGIGLDLEVKHDGAAGVEEFVRDIVRVVRDSPIQGAIQIRSFNYKIMGEFKKVAAELPRTLLVGGPNRASYWTFFFRSAKSIFEEFRPTTIAPHYSLVSLKMLNAWKELGVGVNAWTVDDSAKAKELIDKGVSGITTDRVTETVAVAQATPNKTANITPDRSTLFAGLRRAVEHIANSNFKRRMGEVVVPFVEQRAEVHYLKTSNGSLLNATKFRADHEKGKIVFVPGKGNSWLEFIEPISYYVNEGFTVYTMDLPGQGLASRLNVDPLLVHLTEQKRYTSDLAEFIDRFVEKDSKPLFFVGLSTGAPVGIDYEIQHPNSFKGMVLLAPFLKFKNSLLLQTVRFFVRPFTSNYIPVLFQNRNGPDFTHMQPEKLAELDDKPRAQWRLALAASLPGVITLKVTRGWMDTMFDFLKGVRDESSQIKIPFLVLQAENDTIVDKPAQQEIVRANGFGQFVVVPGAPHQMQQSTDAAMSFAKAEINKFLCPLVLEGEGSDDYPFPP